MARYPAAGIVKTRLARRIGGDRAAALYAAFLRDLQARFSGARRTLVWMFDPPDSEFRAWIGPQACCVPQRGGDLGARMHNAFRSLCGEGFATVIVIGADAPHIRDEWIDEAETALDSADVVLGPTDDGGYYLIAMRAPHDVFSGIEMSTARVLTQTQDKAMMAGLRVRLLPRTFDIDEADDLVRLQALLGNASYPQLPHTEALLRNWNTH
jgi:rSAM/selenodomain-associated transferase 1